MNNEKILKQKIRWYLLTPMILTVMLVGMVAVLYVHDRQSGVIAGIAVTIFLLCEIVLYIVMKTAIMPVVFRFALEQGQIQKELLKELDIPYALLDTDGKILWGNAKFVEDIGDGAQKRIRKNINMIFPAIDSEALSSEEMQMDLEYNDRVYRAILRRIDFTDALMEPDEETPADHKADAMITLYLYDETELRTFKKENEDQKLVAGLLYIDNYDEVMDNTEEVRHSLVEALVDRRINMYLSTIDAIGKKMEKDKYFFVFRQQYLPQLRETKFAILDEVKSINVGNEIPVTLSIGVGAGTDSFTQAYERARTAIGLALGRGGDQAVVKYGDKTTYFGGKSAGTEKSATVKARVKAQAFQELLTTKDSVIIMAHKRPDADAFGSAVGVYRLVKTLNKKASIVVNEVTSAIRPIISGFMGNSVYGDDMIINSEQAISQVTPNTLVVVTDVNKPSMTECEELLSLAKSIVVFDHHRQSDEIIANATLSYIEPYASSACEMIAEILQYIEGKVKLRPIEADAMYAGIVIDTDNFLTKTGVRTFDAASYLRRSGADVVRVRKMFREDANDYRAKADAVGQAKIYMDEYAISVCHGEDTSAPTVVCAQAANELLNIKGIKASFVLTQYNQMIYISARSIDEVNVQVIMEKLGGGGHMNVAGAQLKDISMETACERIRDTLKEMKESGEI